MATVVQSHRRELQREYRERGRREVREADPQAVRRPKQVLRRAAADTDARDKRRHLCAGASVEQCSRYEIQLLLFDQ